MKPKRPAKERVAAERLMWGNLLGASPLVQELANKAREDVLAGESEAIVRMRIRSRCESEGIAGPRMILPALTRKVLRIPMRKVLHACVDLILERTKARKFGDFTKWMSDTVGWDKWLEDFLYQYATTGEPGPIYESMTGLVKRLDLGPVDDKTPVVVLVATPVSDTIALVDLFEETCRNTFQAATFANRSEASEEGSRYFRMNREGMSFSQIAYDNMAARYPEMLASDDDAEFYLFEEIVKRETNTITRLASRTFDRADRIVESLSPSED